MSEESWKLGFQGRFQEKLKLGNNIFHEEDGEGQKWVHSVIDNV